MTACVPPSSCASATVFWALALSCADSTRKPLNTVCVTVTVAWVALPISNGLPPAAARRPGLLMCS